MKSGVFSDLRIAVKSVFYNTCFFRQRFRDELRISSAGGRGA